MKIIAGRRTLKLKLKTMRFPLKSKFIRLNSMKLLKNSFLPIKMSSSYVPN